MKTGANLVKQMMISSDSLDDFLVNFTYFIANIKISIEPLYCRRIYLRNAEIIGGDFDVSSRCYEESEQVFCKITLR